MTHDALSGSASAPAKVLGILHECSDCGVINRLSDPVVGSDMRCVRCDNVLRHVHNNSLTPALACAITALFFFGFLLGSPLIFVMLYGHTHEGALPSGALTLDDQGYWLLASVILLTTVVMPFIKIVGTMIVLIRVRFANPPFWVARLYALLKHLNPWAMVEVYLLGFLVAYTRLQQITQVNLGMAIYALVGLVLSVAAMDASIDAEVVWDAIKKRGAVFVADPTKKIIGCDTCFQVSHAEAGQVCPRCGEKLHNRKPNSLARAWAMMIAALILYVPSNMFPIMTVTKGGKVQSYTIFGGIQELAHIHLMPLAVLVFVASIAIPVFKLVMLGYMLIETHRHSSLQLCNRTRLYRVIDFIGRWSMVDIYMVSILVAVVRFGWFGLVVPEAGAVYFASVVVLTMLAVAGFDPRLMWDAAQSPRLGKTWGKITEKPSAKGQVA